MNQNPELWGHGDYFQCTLVTEVLLHRAKMQNMLLSMNHKYIKTLRRIDILRKNIECKRQYLLITHP